MPHKMEPPHTAAGPAETPYLANGGDRLDVHLERPVHSRPSRAIYPASNPSNRRYLLDFPTLFFCPKLQHRRVVAFCHSCPLAFLLVFLGYDIRSHGLVAHF